MSLLDPSATIILFVLLVLLAGAATVQFFRGRKKNLSILEKSIRILEDVFKPKDKNYTIIGIYVGYSALLKIKKAFIDTVEAVVLLFPRQSMLYAPIARLTSRYDRAYVIIHYTKDKNFPGEAHIVQKGFYRLGIRRAIRNIEKMKVEETRIAGRKYYLIYTNRYLVEQLINYLKNLEDPTLVKHLAVVPWKKRLYMALKLDIDKYGEILSKYYELAKRI